MHLSDRWVHSNNTRQFKKTALYYAVEYQNTKVVQILSDLGADVNEVSMKNNHIPECVICI